MKRSINIHRYTHEDAEIIRNNLQQSLECLYEKSYLAEDQFASSKVKKALMVYALMGIIDPDWIQTFEQSQRFKFSDYSQTIQAFETLESCRDLHRITDLEKNDDAYINISLDELAAIFKGLVQNGKCLEFIEEIKQHMKKIASKEEPKIPVEGSYVKKSLLGGFKKRQMFPTNDSLDFTGYASAKRNTTKKKKHNLF